VVSRILLRRLALLPALVFVASLVAFLLPELTGVDPAQSVLRARATERAPDPAVVQRLERELGLDRPAVVRYAYWARDLARGDLGFSYVDRSPVVPKLLRAFGVTASLVAVSLALGVGVGVPLGVWAAHRGGWIDRLVTGGSQLGISVPEYVSGPVLILVLAVSLGVLPSAGWQGPQNLVLPALTLGASAAAFSTHLMRAEVTEALSHPSVRTARAKGVRSFRVLWRHAVPNALTAVTSVMGVWVAGLLGGSVVVEVIFSVPGLGRTLYDAVVAGDIPVIQGGLVLAVAAATAANLVAELLQLLWDPAVREAR
jgi:ABC-type dipeptide/oligopeptide/nickel transport system permease component